MGWSKRGNGKSYNSLNGYGSMIGFLSGKILDYGVRNRTCKLCDKGHPPEHHDCRQNHNGSAKSMEASVGVELANRSEILREAGLRVRVLVCDEDSSTIAAVRTGSEAYIYKFADTNHLYKHFNESLIKMKPKFKKIRAVSAIPHIKKNCQVSWDAW
ncbi:hypothetical protein PV327_011492 [Microctonus hyperodae]|uniref:Mutator-like transposase domain-containing protein n=1 Tax=Microctonus hyperodae TaxID=165561 RepID=A0AA39FH99_MICHY|nr:hypothetical protein PV327_011492 [Microctonus hyperodae]